MLTIPTSEQGSVIGRVTFPSGQTYCTQRDAHGRLLAKWQETVAGNYCRWPAELASASVSYKLLPGDNYSC